MKKSHITIATLFFLILLSYSSAFSIDTTVVIFDQNVIHFSPDSANKYDTENVKSSDNGRVIKTQIKLPDTDKPQKITAYLAIHPIPKDDYKVYDSWDRAGDIRLVREGMADIELIKFMTSFGGFTEYEVDLSDLAPLLKGECTFKGFIDTWVSPAWKIDFELTFEPYEHEDLPVWAEGVLYAQNYTAKDYGEKGVEVEVNIPENLKTVKLHYLTSGHCTDGSEADEFISKDNVIYVDDVAVYRFQPWRDDCRDFRAINPYSGRWSDGSWSSDFSRSGWCPGDMVYPVELDLSDHLTPGSHTMKFVVEDVRPDDDEGHHGYWRISGYLLGWDKKLHRQNE